MARLTALHGLFLHGNPALGIPESVLGLQIHESHGYAPDGSPPRAAARPADILNFYFAQRHAAAAGTLRRLNEIKLMLVGDGGAGKTSLRRFFMGHKHLKKEPETLGIALGDFPLRCGDEEIRVHLWDFAGQDHARAAPIFSH
jgi:hypothetical protein